MRLKRRGLGARHRQGYVDRSPTDRLRERLAAALWFDAEVDELRARLSFGAQTALERWRRDRRRGRSGTVRGARGTRSADEEPGPAEQRAGIRVRVTGLHSDDGRLACGLFDASSPGVEPGTCAVSTCHDEHGNSRLDTGFMRIPKEGTAASNDAYRESGPPRYRDARFVYEDGVLEHEAEMRSLGGG